MKNKIKENWATWLLMFIWVLICIGFVLSAAGCAIAPPSQEDAPTFIEGDYYIPNRYVDTEFGVVCYYFVRPTSSGYTSIDCLSLKELSK